MPLYNPTYWTTDGVGIKRLSHIAVGANASVNSTGASQAVTGTISAVILNQEEMTDVIPGTSSVILNDLIANSSANSNSTWLAQNGILETKVGNAVDYTGSLLGDAGAVYHYGTGTITTAAGVFGLTENQSSGTIINAYAGRFGSINYGSGPVTSQTGVQSVWFNVGTTVVTNNYGLRIESPTLVGGSATNNYGAWIGNQSAVGGTKSYNFYSEGNTARHYMAGKLGIGTGSTHANFGTNHRLLVGAASTLDNAARVQMNAEVATDKPLVVQGFAAQSANLQDWQNSAGTILARVDKSGYVGINTGASATIGKLDIRNASGDYTTPLMSFHNDNSTGQTGWKIVMGGNGDYAGRLKFYDEAQTQNSWSLALLSATDGYGASSTYRFSAPTFSSFINARGDADISKWTNDGANSISGTYDAGQSYAYGGAPATFSKFNAWIGSTATSTFNVVRHTDVVNLLSIQGSTGNITPIDGANIVLNATTGMKIGTATTQKLAFYNSTPVVQQTSDVNALVTYGLLASISSATFTKEVAATISVADTTTASTAGAALTILGAGGKGTAVGGAISITAGSADTGGVGGAINLTAGAGANLSKGGNTNILSGAGFTGGDIKLDPGTGLAGAKILFGSVRYAPVGIGQATPTARLHLGAGTTTTAPLKFTTGTNLTTPEVGSLEFASGRLNFTHVLTRNYLTSTQQVDTTTVGNVGIGEDDLITYSVPANTLATNGDYISFRCSGTIANSINAKRLRVKFGATTIMDTGAAGFPISTAIQWVLEGEIIRTGAATQKCNASLSTNNASLATYVGYSTAAETLSGAVTVKLTGEAVTDSDIIQETFSMRIN